MLVKPGDIFRCIRDDYGEEVRVYLYIDHVIDKENYIGRIAYDLNDFVGHKGVVKDISLMDLQMAEYELIRRRNL